MEENDIEKRAIALLYCVACDLEKEVIERGGNDTLAVKNLSLWRKMDASLSEYKELMLAFSEINNDDV